MANKIKMEMQQIEDRLVGTSDFYDYLDLLKIVLPDYLIILSVRDTPGNMLNSEILKKIHDMGFRGFTKELWRMYIGISAKGNIVCDAVSKKREDRVVYDGQFAEVNISVSSEAWRKGNSCKIAVDNEDFAVNKRGINLVVYDIENHRLVDSVCYDAHDGEQGVFSRRKVTELKKHYSVAVVGVWFGLNYGSLINGYAIYKLLKDMGLDVLMVNKPNVLETDGELQNPHCKRFIKRFYEKSEISPPLPYDKLHELNKCCDIFLAGSDQIWHHNIINGFQYTTLLNFVEDSKKRISFGTSFGHQQDFTLVDERKKVKELLRKFNCISVREQASAEILSSIYSVKSTVTIEPVFCLELSDYKQIGACSQIQESDSYIFTYILDPTPEIISAIEYYSNASGMKIINMFDGNPAQYKKSKEMFNLPNTLEGEEAGAEDLINLCLNAAFVITDSFHGTCFAIILNKPFLSITNFRRGAARFQELKDKFGLTERFSQNSQIIPHDISLMKAFDYAEINRRIAHDRQEAIAWLKNAIETPKEQLPGIILLDTVNVVIKENKCTGCGACAQICPSQAITMRENGEGFLAPVVDNEKCTRCGICYHRCPSNNPSYKNEQPECYAVMAEDAVREVSSSGGMFSVAAEYILKQGGYVCGAAFRDDFSVEHVIIENISQIDGLRGSKYIQSDAGSVFPRIKQQLEENNPVLFTGMPCQVAGLYAYLGKTYEKLYTIDLLCHGITSYKVFEKYKKDVLGDKQLTELQFKAKKPWGWHAGVNACFQDGTKYAQPCEKDPYYIAYLNSISKNNICGSCGFNKLPRQGDMTIGDFWGVGKFDAALNDNKGTSVVLVNNNKGRALMETLKSGMQTVKEVPLQVAINGNHIIEHPYMLNKNRTVFFQYLDKLPFAELAEGCRDNRVYEKLHMHIYSEIPAEDREFYFIAKIAAENSKGRRIVTWIRSGRFEGVLKKYFGLSVAFGVSMRKEALKENYILGFSTLRGRAGEYYLVSLDKNYDDETYRKLNSFGYHETRDFVFRMKKPVVLVNYDLSRGNYYDAYGNSIEGFNAVIGKVVFRGFNNHIVLGKNMSTAGNLHFDFCANGYVEIGDETRFNELNTFEFKGYNGCSTAIIGKKCRFRETLWRLFSDAHNTSVTINDSCTFEANLEIHPNHGKKIVIGRDCMFSYDIYLLAGDGHAIFDVNTAKRINETGKGAAHKDVITIGEHVWVGKNAFIMSGTSIGDGSIVGACSVVKGIFPNNCSVGGNPAKQIRTDIAWSRNGYADRLEQCGGIEYAALTSSAKLPISGLNVLVVGGTRFMGICLVKELLARGNKVTIATRGIRPDSFGLHVDRIKMDVTDPESVKKALGGKYFDVVFDNLAYCSLYADNVLSNVKCGKYIQLSSVAAYAQLSPDMSEALFDPYKLPVELCGTNAGYVKGKRQAEAIAYQKYPQFDVVTVRIPYVCKTDRLYYYCKNIVKQIPMDIRDNSHGFTFIRDTEVGKFLPWIAAQSFVGPINLASEGMITMQMLLDYIEKKVGKKALIDTENGANSPFNENTFSQNMDKAKRLGWNTSNIHDWFWKLMDEYIARALQE